MGGGVMWPLVTAAASGTTYTRSSSLAADFHSHQSLAAISRASCIPSPTQSTGLAEACSATLPSFDADDHMDQTSVEGRQDMAARKPYFDLESVPTSMEAKKAIADLQRFMQSGTNSDMKGIQSIEPSSESRMLQSARYGRGGLADAMDMLREDPSMQSTVVSISCDKAVWDAVSSNKAVQELRGSLSAAREQKTQRSKEELDIVDFILKYITEVAKSKVVGLIERFGALVAEILKPANKEKPTSELSVVVEKKIRSSLLLSIVVLLIVIVTRNS